MHTSYAETLYWLAATRMPGMGSIKFLRWLGIFQEMKELFSASESALQAAGLTAREIKALQNPDWQSAAQDYAWCEENQVQVLLQTDAAYPRLLREIPGAPLVLYVRGDIHLLSAPQIAIVGSRNPTCTGREIAEQFAQSLAQAGLVVTSGFALGVDAASHKGAIQAGGKTIAVMGTGLAEIYPRLHTSLAKNIAMHGVLVSEFPPRTLPIAKNFPQRNRLISGLSLGVLVVEAALRSGSLITARYAAEQGREVFAIPGSIHNPLAHGCHALIRQGAKLVEKAADVLEELGALNAVLCESPSVALPGKMLDAKCVKLLTQVGYEPTPVDAITLRSGLTASEVSSMLLILELQGYVYAVSGGYARSSLIS